MKQTNWLCRTIALDCRALACFRVCLGLFLLVDAACRLNMGGVAWYTSSDLDPAAAVHVSDTPHGALAHRILFYRGSAGLQWLLMGIHVALAAAFTLGVRMRLVSVLMWLSLVCLHGRYVSLRYEC